MPELPLSALDLTDTLGQEQELIVWGLSASLCGTEEQLEGPAPFHVMAAAVPFLEEEESPQGLEWS